MGSLYLVDMVAVLEAAGVPCSVGTINTGWERRARGSGGFTEMPLGICWHHTASSTSPSNDLSWMIDGSDDAPIGNLLLDRDGVVWPIAAGAANTQGKGGPRTFSRGMIPADSGNSMAFGMEVANNGVGEPWPSAQVNSYFAASNALSAYFGNQPTDLMTHHEWAPDRKIDPATSAAVQGIWVPGSVTSSGTWSGDDIRHECAHRASGPIPPPDLEDEMATAILHIPGRNAQFIAQGPKLGDGSVHCLFATWFGPGPDPVNGIPGHFVEDHGAAPDIVHQDTLASTLQRDIVFLGNPEDIQDSTGGWTAADFYRVVRS